MSQINWQINKYKSQNTSNSMIDEFTARTLKDAIHFHSSMPGYEETPLYSLGHLANELGVKEIFIKDEAERFNLNAFKALGGSYAMAAYFADKTNLDLSTAVFEDLMQEIQKLDTSTFATVTAGNHGKGVAWAADVFRQNAKVYLPAGSSEERLRAIQELGADAHISAMNYDDAVIHVASEAEKNGWILLQDTAWKEYETLPLFIMKGYTTIVAEILQQLKAQNLSRFTHVFLQAGVGSFAAAMTAAIYNETIDNPPVFVIAEPSEADCLYQSARSESGNPERVYGDLNSMMAGLACGEPNPFAWEILKPVTDAFFSCSDEVSAEGMKILASPHGADPAIISGESGALPIGVLNELMTNNDLAEAKRTLNINKDSSILIINTEGNTNPENYTNIVSN